MTSSSSTTSTNYAHGHAESVLRMHSRRTVADSCQYLLDAGILSKENDPTMRILDVGCGPGSITADIASYVPQGHVVGVEPPSAGEDILTRAREHAASVNASNVTFMAVDVMNMSEFKDGEFDLVHSHQVLQHLPDPVGALREMKRVAKPNGGIVAARCTDFESTVVYPPCKELEDWKTISLKVFRFMDNEPNAGRRVHDWFKQAGFDFENPDKVRITASTWCLSGREGQAGWWGSLWAERTVDSKLGTIAVEKGLASREDLEKVAEAWRRWSKDEMAWFAMIHGEVIARL